MIINKIINECKKASIKEFKNLVLEVNKILESERKTKKINNLNVNEDLIYCSPNDVENCVIIGDIHGDIETLIKILEKINIEKEIKNKKFKIVFLGDYGDRGEKSPEVYYLILSLKKNFSNQVILLRGNHEGTDELQAYPHDLPLFFIEKYGWEGYDIYYSIKKIFDKFYLAFIVLGKFIALHGGIPTNTINLQDIALAKQKRKIFEEILWNDPKEEEGIENSYRGAGKIFGPNITEKFLRRNNLMLLIRGHEPANQGYYITHKGMVITIFSRKGMPYFNHNAAFLNIKIQDLNSKEDIKKFIIVL